MPPCRPLGDQLPVLPSLATLEALLIQEHPLIHAAEAEVRGFDLDLRRANAEAIPDLEVGAGYHRGLDEGANLWSVGIGIPLPLFDRNQGERARFAAMSERATALLEQVRTERLLALRERHAALDAARTTWDVHRTRVLPMAEEAFRRTNEAYRLGHSDYLEVVDARRSLSEARIETLDAKTQSYLTLFELEASVGAPLGVAQGEPR